MIIKSVTLENFRQFKNKTRMEFFVDGGRNVAVFLGENGYGKTTLINSIIWAIYDVEKIDMDRPTELLNKKTKNDLQINDTAVVSVEVVLKHSDTEYIFSRKQTYKCKNKGEVRLEDDDYAVWYVNGGETIRSRSPVQDRDKILPEDLKDYFFFDGEHISKLNEKKNLKQSIAKLLGLLPLQNAVKDLQKVVSKIDNSLPREGNRELTIALREKSELEQHIESLNEQKNSEEMGYKFATQAYNASVEKMSSMELYSKLIDDRKKYGENLRKESDLSSERLMDCSKKFNSVYYNVLSAELFEETLELMGKIKSSGLTEDAVPFMHADSIKHILKKGKCICGADLNEHPELVDHITKLMNVLPPNSIGSEVLAFEKELTTRMESVGENIDSFNRTVDSYLDSLNKLDELMNNINECDSKLRGVDQGNISAIRNEFYTNESTKNRIYKRMIELDSSISLKKQELNKKRSEIDKLSSNDEKYLKPRICKKYAEELMFSIERSRELKEKDMIKHFEEVLNEVFFEMYHGKRTIHVDENYNVHLYVEGEETAISEGTQAVLGFAYVCSLLKMAIQHIGDEEMAIDSHALVMDAPISTQDDDHIQNVFRYTVTVADQIIMFIKNSDWEKVKSEIETKVNRKYRLHYVNEWVTNIEVIE